VRTEFYKNENMRSFFLNTFKRKKEPLTLFVFFMAFLFTFTCAYSLFDAIREVDFLSPNKFEATDIEEVYVEKQSTPDAALVFPALFAPLWGIILGFLPSFSTPNILFTPTFSVLRC
jgi:hypothetical protein